MQSDIDIQITLFQIIEEKIKDPDRTTAEMMELLCIEKRSLRNRQRGTTYLTGPEFYRLARHFDIRLYDIELQLQQQAAAEGRPENHRVGHHKLYCQSTPIICPYCASNSRTFNNISTRCARKWKSWPARIVPG